MRINVVKKLIKEGKSSWLMAKELGCSQSTVAYWLKKYGLKTLCKQFNSGGKYVTINGKNVFVKSSEPHCIICGEKDPSLFYTHKKSLCKKCDNLRSVKIMQDNRTKIKQYLGGKCIKCGFDKYKSALSVHHLDPNLKDPSFNTSRGWSWERIEKEIKKCVLLCSNCHAAIHGGELIL